jgi:hypothetical protein
MLDLLMERILLVRSVDVPNDQIKRKLDRAIKRRRVERGLAKSVARERPQIKISPNSSSKFTGSYHAATVSQPGKPKMNLDLNYFRDPITKQAGLTGDLRTDVKFSKAEKEMLERHPVPSHAKYKLQHEKTKHTRQVSKPVVRQGLAKAKLQFPKAEYFRADRATGAKAMGGPVLKFKMPSLARAKKILGRTKAGKVAKLAINLLD